MREKLEKIKNGFKNLKTGKIEMGTVIKILIGLGVGLVLVAGYLLVTLGWFGRIGVIVLSLGLYSWLKDAFFYIHKKPEEIPYFINKWNGEIRPGHLGTNVKIPLIEEAKTESIERQIVETTIHATIKGTEIDFNLLLAYTPNPKRFLRFLRAGDIKSQIIARVEDVLNREAGPLILEDILTVKKADLGKIVEFELTQGPIRAMMQKIRIIDKDIADLEADKKRAEGDKKKQKEIEFLIEHNKNYLVDLIKLFDGAVKKHILHKEEMATFKDAQEKEETETARQEILGYLRETNSIIMRIDAKLLKKTEREEITDLSEEEEEEGIRITIERHIRERGIRPKVLEELRHSPLEIALGINLTKPDLRKYIPEEDASKQRTQKMIAEYQVGRLDQFINQKQRAITTFLAQGVPPEQGLDATLIDAGKNVHKHKHELIGLKEVAEALKAYFSTREKK